MQELFSFPGFQCALAFQKDSPYARYINYQLLDVKMFGGFIKYKKRHQPDALNCKDDEDTGAISIKKVFSAFTVMILGIGMAIAVGLVEKIVQIDQVHFEGNQSIE